MPSPTIATTAPLRLQRGDRRALVVGQRVAARIGDAERRARSPRRLDARSPDSSIGTMPSAAARRRAPARPARSVSASANSAMTAAASPSATSVASDATLRGRVGGSGVPTARRRNRAAERDSAPVDDAFDAVARQRHATLDARRTRPGAPPRATRARSDAPTSASSAAASARHVVARRRRAAAARRRAATRPVGQRAGLVEDDVGDARERSSASAARDDHLPSRERAGRGGERGRRGERQRARDTTRRAPRRSPRARATDRCSHQTSAVSGGEREQRGDEPRGDPVGDARDARPLGGRALDQPLDRRERVSPRRRR